MVETGQWAKRIRLTNPSVFSFLRAFSGFRPESGIFLGLAFEAAQLQVRPGRSFLRFWLGELFLSLTDSSLALNFSELVPVSSMLSFTQV